MSQRLLLTVEDKLEIQTRGTLVLPAIEGINTSYNIRIRLELPDGATREADASLCLPFGPPDMKSQLWCLIKDVPPHEIPLGTKVFEIA